MRHPHRDVLVVGHGIVGAIACWRAAVAGLTVTCLDPDPDHGASHAAAGMLAPVTEADFGESDLLELNLAAMARWPQFAADVQEASGIEVGYHRCGVLTVGYERADRDQLDRLAALQQQHGLAVEPLTSAEARDREPRLGSRGVGGYWVPDDGQVDPRRLLTALARIGSDRGVRTLPRQATVLLKDGADRKIIGVVDEAGDHHPADLVVLAGGYATGSLINDDDRLRIPTRPVKGQLIRLDGVASGWPEEPRIVRGFVQQRPIYLVFRGPEHDHREVVIGATSEEWPDDRQITAGAVFSLLRDARAIMPGIDELTVRELTTRARPATPDNLPILGRTAIPGMIVATGHYRNGILLAPATADAFDAIYSDRTPDPVWNVADPGRFAPVEIGASA